MESAVVVILSVILSIGLLSMCVHRVRAQNAEMRALAAIIRNRQTPAVAEGIDPEAINGFPVIKYSEVKEIKIGKGIIDCAVCLSEFNDEDLVRLLPECDHVFHPLCIDKWLASHATCPVCRTNLLHVPEPHNSSVSNIVVININDDDDRHSTANLISSEASKSHLTPNQKVQISSSETVELHSSHSTGDSRRYRGEGFDKHSLRLPKDAKKKLQIRQEDEELDVVVLSRGEGCSRMGNVDDQMDK